MQMRSLGIVFGYPCLYQTAECDHEYMHVSKPCAILLRVRPKYRDLVSLVNCNKSHFIFCAFSCFRIYWQLEGQ